MMSWFQTAIRNIKIPEKFIDIQKTLRNGKFMDGLIFLIEIMMDHKI